MTESLAAAYVLFEELFNNSEVFRCILTKKTVIPVRILGRVAGLDKETNLIELMSPSKGDSLPCLLVNIDDLPSGLQSDLKRQSTLTGHRLLQLMGELRLSDDGCRFQLTAHSMTFMDGVELGLYNKVVHLTRRYAEHLPELAV